MSEVKETVRTLRRAMLPSFRKIFESIAPFALFCHPRMTGKSHNVVLGIMATAIERGENACFARLWEESLADSLWREVVGRVESLGLSSLFSVTRARITYKPTGVVFFFRGLANPESIKGLQGVSILHIDEVQQIRQETMQLVIPSIRGRERLIVLTGNLPATGQDHWIYKTFYTDKLPSYETYDLGQEQNTVAFPSLSTLEKWREEQAVFFRGRRDAYEREILGHWVSRSARAMFPHLSVQELAGLGGQTGTPDLWLYGWGEGRTLWLAVRVRGDSLEILGKSSEDLPIGFNRLTPIWLSRRESLAVEIFRSCGFRLVERGEVGLESIAQWFARRSLVLDVGLVDEREELAGLAWGDEDGEVPAPKLSLLTQTLGLLVGG